MARLSHGHGADSPQDSFSQPANEVASCRQHSQAGPRRGLLGVILGPIERGMHEASEETHHIPAPGPTMQGRRVADLLLPSSGGLQRFPSTVYVGTASSSEDRKKEEGDSWTEVGESAESLLLALE